MAGPRAVRKNINLFVDGRGQAGQIDEYNAPKLSLKTEEYQGGGMYGPLELTMGHEKLECDFTLISYDTNVLRNFGLVEGQQIQLTARQALEDWDGTVTALVHNMRGKIRAIDPGTSKSGEKPSMKIEMALSYYKETANGIVVHEVDVENMKFIKDGVDILQAFRSALGI
ncbi:head closure [Xanthomonas phage FoX2]|uniref:Major tail tube protein n=1 Tax=Xanthomonas phage FoX2 TaxID=2723898 RepID=A0A858NNJ6_9CAUD|nr:head closure [Xanthomonas phage FoX2]QJB21840.1 major tail tube protein [Xanthomonas phage FoX2]QWY14239.1 pyocin tube [Xanthomonas phage M29]WNL50856.1 tail tube protein [Xanthomonas phage Murka]